MLVIVTVSRLAPHRLEPVSAVAVASLRPSATALCALAGCTHADSVIRASTKERRVGYQPRVDCARQLGTAFHFEGAASSSKQTLEEVDRTVFTMTIQ